jgi:hypothetical protein
MPDICNNAMRDWLLSPQPAERSIPAAARNAA